jgi:hypothetical protein
MDLPVKKPALMTLAFVFLDQGLGGGVLKHFFL